MAKIPRKCPILLVDDNPHDYEATKRSFKQIGLTHPLMYCADGDEAMNLLKGQSLSSPGAPPPLPCLILLDLNLPGTDGRELLDKLKQDVYLRTIPVVILTTSTDPIDIESCYVKGANSYMVKPVDYDGLVEAMKRLCQFWFEAAQVPSVT